MYQLNFIAYAYDKKGHVYESFLIPFAFFALIHNPNSHVEIIVLDVKKFTVTFCNEIKQLREINNNFVIRKATVAPNNNLPNTYRFFEIPTIQAEYTYIADIDIMFMNDILPKYLENWPGDLCYNNMLRFKGKDRLTGVHLAVTNKYYTPQLKAQQRKYHAANKNTNDEVILAKMCKEVHGLPPFSHRFRPIYGIHFSPNRGKGKRMQLTTKKAYVDRFDNLKTEYPVMFNFTCFKNLERQLRTQFNIA